jgi:hypothetical protein
MTQQQSWRSLIASKFESMHKLLQKKKKSKNKNHKQKTERTYTVGYEITTKKKKR